MRGGLLTSSYLEHPSPKPLAPPPLSFLVHSAPILGYEPGNRDNGFRKEAGVEMWPKEEGVITQCPASSGKFKVSTLPLEPLSRLPPALALSRPPARRATRLAGAPTQHTWGPSILLARAGVGRGQAGSGGLQGLGFRGKQPVLPLEGSRRLRLLQAALSFSVATPSLPLSSRSVASTACTTRSCSSNMTPHQPTSCSSCDQLQISRRATWWRWFCRVRSGGHPGGGASGTGPGLWEGWPRVGMVGLTCNPNVPEAQTREALYV